MKIKKDDVVFVISGKDKGKKGKVRFVHAKHRRVTVEGINFVTRHTRARGRVRQAGLVEREAPINLSNVMLICTKCNQPARTGHRVLADKRRVRICKSCQEMID